MKDDPYKCPDCGGVLKYEGETRDSKKYKCVSCGSVLYGKQK